MGGGEPEGRQSSPRVKGGGAVSMEEIELEEGMRSMGQGEGDEGHPQSRSCDPQAGRKE